MQQRLVNLRQSLCSALRDNHHTDQFDFIEHHKGMFTVLGFSENQMIQLREDYGIYGVGDGRINIAGLTETHIPYVADAIHTVSQR
jgi:aspartate aminotransferase